MISHKICKMIISLTSTLRWVTRPGPDKIMEEQTLKKTNILHDGKRKHICNQCNYSTNRTSSLKKHKLVHSGEKPFACSQCKYSCTEAGSLKRHLLIHSGENPFKCRQCDYSCKRAGNLKSHILTHSGKKAFKCTQCNHSFSLPSNLKKHLLTQVTLGHTCVITLYSRNTCSFIQERTPSSVTSATFPAFKLPI